MTIIDPSNFLINNCLSGIICLESASYWNAMSCYPPVPVKVYTECDISIECEYVYIIPVKKFDYRYTVNIHDDLFVTNPARTVIELIKQDGEEQFIFESLEDYLIEHSKEELYEVADAYGEREHLDEKILEMDDFFLDFRE